MSEDPFEQGASFEETCAFVVPCAALHGYRELLDASAWSALD